MCILYTSIHRVVFILFHCTVRLHVYIIRTSICDVLMTTHRNKTSAYHIYIYLYTHIESKSKQGNREREREDRLYIQYTYMLVQTIYIYATYNGISQLYLLIQKIHVQFVRTLGQKTQRDVFFFFFFCYFVQFRCCYVSYVCVCGFLGQAKAVEIV